MEAVALLLVAWWVVAWSPGAGSAVGLLSVLWSVSVWEESGLQLAMDDRKSWLDCSRSGRGNGCLREKSISQVAAERADAEHKAEREPDAPLFHLHSLSISLQVGQRAECALRRIEPRGLYHKARRRQKSGESQMVN